MHPVEELVAALVTGWRQEAELYRRRGLLEAAGLLASVAADTRRAVEEWLDEPLTLREAAELARCGYSTIQHQLRDGDVPNAGERGRPRVRRRDLPMREYTAPGLMRTSTPIDGDDLDELMEICDS